MKLKGRGQIDVSYLAPAFLVIWCKYQIIRRFNTKNKVL